MALKQLIITRKISEKTAKLEKLKAAQAEQATKRAAMKKREEELEQAVQEITEQTEEAVKAEVDAAVAEFEADAAALEAEVKQTETDVAAVEAEIEELKGELEEIQQKLDEPAEEIVIEDRPEDEDATRARRNERSDRHMPHINTRAAYGRIVTRDDVKTFLTRVREFAAQKRAVTGGELTIPQVLLSLVREQIEESSKLLRYVNLQSVPGTARQTIMGSIPEGVWTEMCATLNELALSFSGVEVDGFKVGGYIPVCNALLYDNDVDLAGQIVYALNRAIGLALDKAILYGTGTKMPRGILPRLAQTAQPEGYPATAPAWVDLHTTNITTITAANSTGIKLFQSILHAFGAAKKKYGTGGKFWAMNEKTHMVLTSEALTFNAAGAIVSGIDQTMPVIGGDIVELDFIPDNVILAGYGENYLLAEREGMAIDQSEHVRFIQDQTVFRGIARYDGLPVIPEAFVAIGINGATVSATAVTFAEDTANG